MFHRATFRIPEHLEQKRRGVSRRGREVSRLIEFGEVGRGVAVSRRGERSESPLGVVVHRRRLGFLRDGVERLERFQIVDLRHRARDELDRGLDRVEVVVASTRGVDERDAPRQPSRHGEEHVRLEAPHREHERLQRLGRVASHHQGLARAVDEHGAVEDEPVQGLVAGEGDARRVSDAGQRVERASTRLRMAEGGVARAEEREVASREAERCLDVHAMAVLLHARTVRLVSRGFLPSVVLRGEQARARHHGEALASRELVLALGQEEFASLDELRRAHVVRDAPVHPVQELAGFLLRRPRLRGELRWRGRGRGGRGERDAVFEDEVGIRDDRSDERRHHLLGGDDADGATGRTASLALSGYSAFSNSSSKASRVIATSPMVDAHRSLRPSASRCDGATALECRASKTRRVPNRAPTAATTS